MKHDFSMNPVLWLWIPLGWMALQITGEILIPQPILARMHTEDGLHEVLQFMVIFVAFLAALRILPMIDWRNDRWLGAWVTLAAICSLYVAGEEMSWGQHILKWSTPEYWTQFNDQNETNLHNTSAWLDQKPRLLLEIGVYGGGLLLPLLRQFRPQWIPKRFEIIYPPSSLLVIALIMAIMRVSVRIAEEFNVQLFERDSEVTELYMFYFVLLYLIALRSRIRTS